MAKNRQEPKALVLAPHAVSHQITNEGFKLSFTGCARAGRRRSVTLSFPLWWTGQLANELHRVLDGKQAEINKQRTAIKELP